MKKFIPYLFVSILFMVFSMSVYSGPRINFLYNNNDSLLYDGAEESSDVIKLSEESCWIIVNYAVDASGEILKRKISNICGERDTG